MTQSGNVSAEQLLSFIERIERLEEEASNIKEDIKSVFAEAKSTGFDVKTMRTIIKLRRMKEDQMEEEEFLLETYKRALGMVDENDMESEADAMLSKAA